MKKLLSMVTVLALCLSLSACDGSTQADTPKESNSQQQTTDMPSVPREDPEKDGPSYELDALESSGVLGDYAVDIQGFELAEDYEGSPAIIVSYLFTNNAAEATSGMVALVDRAFQNGVQLDTAIIADSAVLNSEDQMKDIQNGASIELKSAFLLTSDTAPVEYEIEEFASFSEDKLGEQFEISPGGETVLSAAPVGDISGDIGDFHVSIVSYKESKDYEGKPAVIVTLGFTNNSDETADYMTALDCSAFQDGIELETAIIGGDDSGSGVSQMRSVRPGAGVPVTVAYLLTSETSPVELEITEWISFSDDKLVATLNIAE